jgi:ribonuclease HI
MQVVEMYTDGACRGNPGPGGWGVLLRYNNQEKRLSGAELQSTNNRMELQAAIEGLNALTRPCHVILFTDSQYVKNGITTWIHTWRKKGWQSSTKQPVKNKDLWEALDQALQRHNVEWHWVKGHSNHPENDIVDHLARQAIDQLFLDQTK